MRVKLVSRISLGVGCSVFVLAAAGFLSDTASAQDSHSSALPADIHPDSLSRLPLLSRDDLDAEGKAAFDHVVGDGEAPRTGPVPASFYSPAIARSWHDLNSFIRYNGDLSPRHTEVAILVAAWEIEQQYEWSAHEPAALRFGAPQEVIDTARRVTVGRWLGPTR